MRTIIGGGGNNRGQTTFSARPAVNLAESTGLNVTMPTAEESKQAFVERSQRRTRESDGSK